MTRDISEDPSSKNAQSDRPKKETGAGGELELVLRSGGVYCFVKRISSPDLGSNLDDDSSAAREKAVSSPKSEFADHDSQEVFF